MAGFAVPFLTFGSEGSLLGVFQRNLIVTDTDLVVDKDQTPGEPSVSLRGRDLRFAKLDRTRPASGRPHRRRPEGREPRRHRLQRRLAAVRRRDGSCS